MKGLIFKFLGKFISHTHKVVEVMEEFQCGEYFATGMRMDCHVQPLKVVVTTRRLELNEEFDPHFSNPEVFARFTPTENGFDAACELIKALETK
jgi:hypothetical protein